MRRETKDIKQKVGWTNYSLIDAFLIKISNMIKNYVIDFFFIFFLKSLYML
jgi:hypothetical protein